MNQKLIGIIIIIIGVLLATLITTMKVHSDSEIDAVIEETGSCYLDDGTCLHDEQSNAMYVAGWILSAALIILGAYLVFFDKTQQLLAEQQKEVSSALKAAKKEDSFKAFLAGFSDEEQSVLKAIKEQDGIKQSTLRYRTGMSKTSLSLLLKSLESKKIISRKTSGKTNEVFLRKKF